MHDMLKLFLSEFNLWLRGIPANVAFTKDEGLCWNWKLWLKFHHPDLVEITVYKYLINDHFKSLGWDDTLPFNEEIDHFWVEKNMGTLYENNYRLAFIRNNS